MQKDSSFFSAADISPYGVEMISPRTLDSAVLSKIIKTDINLSPEKKESMLAILDNPQTFNKLMAGYSGGKLADAIAEYKNMGIISKTLLGAAGFSLGQMLYGILFNEGHFTKENVERNKYQVKL